MNWKINFKITFNTNGKVYVAFHFKGYAREKKMKSSYNDCCEYPRALK
jgi:hypothetical protein